MIEDQLRGTGRTTRQALAYTQECLDKAGQWITIEDHSGNPASTTNLHHLVFSLLVLLSIPVERQGTKLRVPYGLKKGSQNETH